MKSRKTEWRSGKTLRTVALLVVVFMGVAGHSPSATAGKQRQPVRTTLYFHGELPMGEVEMGLSEIYLRMDPTPPLSGLPKSRWFYGVMANSQCAGSLDFPVWVGKVSGRIVGDMEVTFHKVSTAGLVEVRVWPDVYGAYCDQETFGYEDYIKPAASARVELQNGAGKVKVTLRDVRFEARELLMVQLTPLSQIWSYQPFTGRVLYDSDDFSSAITFDCIPSVGKTCNAAN